MNYAGIKYCDIANGSGCRTVLFVSGCRNACKGCFQPQTWDFCYGKPFDEAVQQEVIDSLEPEYITGITLLGGEPFEPENQAALLPFMKKVKEKYPNKNVWAFTGYIYDKDLIPGGRKIHKRYRSASGYDRRFGGWTIRGRIERYYTQIPRFIKSAPFGLEKNERTWQNSYAILELIGKEA